MTFDRALIVRAEWLDLILQGVKSWEMRSKHTNVRGRIGLIEAGSGCVVGTACLTDSIGPLSSDEWRANVHRHKVPYRGCEQLSAKWSYAWVLQGTERFETPIKYEHPRGAVVWVKFSR